LQAGIAAAHNADSEDVWVSVNKEILLNDRQGSFVDAWKVTYR